MSVFSTTGMTLFSYILSRTINEKFLETEQLNRLAFPKEQESNKHHPAGIAIHYLVGTIFSSVYYILWKNTSLRAVAPVSSALGLLNGLIGISGWHVTFRLLYKPAVIKLKYFYPQLLIAHIIFGCMNGQIYRINKLKSENMKKNN